MAKKLQKETREINAREKKLERKNEEQSKRKNGVFLAVPGGTAAAVFLLLEPSSFRAPKEK
jgi:hypothetical protein